MTNKTKLNPNNEDIDIKHILNFLFREKLLIGGITFFGTLVGIIYSLIQEPVYNGFFQIIVESEKGQNTAANIPSNSLGNISNFLSFGSGNSYNKTQEAILKSPSVLKPVYEFVKNNYSESEPKLLDTSYQQWLKDYLVIEFEEDTNVLNINYRNKNKEAIIKTLNKISSKYQSYSKRDREISIKRGLSYLESQEQIFKAKSKKSLKEFNKFSIDNGLGDIDGFVDLNDSSALNLIAQENGLQNTEFFNQRSERDKKVKDSGAGLRYSKQFDLLSRYESRYVDLKSRLKPNSKILTRYKNSIENLKESLKRPNEILIEFRNLKRIASRDELVLRNIENNLISLRLEQVRQQAPWELITEPTIDDLRISPKRKQITIYFFILSGLLGIILGYFKEKKDDLINEESVFHEIIPFEFIDTLIPEEKELNNLVIRKFFNHEKTNSKKIGIINPSISSSKINETFDFDYLSRELNGEIITFKEVDKLKKYENILLIAKEGNVTFEKFKIVIKYLKTFNFQKIGWVFIKKGSKNFF